MIWPSFFAACTVVPSRPARKVSAAPNELTHSALITKASCGEMLFIQYVSMKTPKLVGAHARNGVAKRPLHDFGIGMKATAVAFG